MLRLGSRLTSHVSLGLATLLVGALGCTAGVNQTTPTGGGTAGTSAGGSAGTSATGLGGFLVGGRGGAGGSATGTGGTLPVPPGCGDGINNQGGVEACDDGNTVAGDGCNGACRVEPNWTCPPAGACARNFACGDGVINPGEVCDDRNTADNDGCNATCTVQDPAFICTPGTACVRSSMCGNRRVEPGEKCDDGNATASDGCSATCQVEQGWVCPTPGMPCARAPRCGDGVVQATLSEVCDDGNITEGDGCSSDCRVKGAGCSCQPGMRCVCPEVRCGNGSIEGNEKCDDGNANSGDGCSSTCTIESGYVCPLVRAPCVPDCGDGVLKGNEQCDPGIAIQRMACSDLCRWNTGWACTGNPPTECHRTTCGDGRKEGAESCDDSNTNPFDGCSATCQAEPACPASGSGTCSGKCGDGLLLGGEQCDDGNNLAGDGCSGTCTMESGFMCMQPPLGDYIDVPVTYRDFQTAHVDFEPGATGQNNPVTGLVGAMLDAEGKPMFVGTAGQGYINSAASFRDWYRSGGSIPNHATNSTLRLCRNTAGNYVNRWGPNCEPWPVTKIAYFCGNVGNEVLDPTTGAPIPCTFRFGTTDCDMQPAGAIRISCTAVGGNYQAVFQTGTLDGTPVFFPVDADTYTPAAERATATIGPPYEATGGYPPEMPAVSHNFSFTSEVRYWFPYNSSQSYTLKFLGDDDVWVFINGRLATAADLGGIHTAVGCNSLVATCAIGQVTISAANNFGMTNGNVYQIVVFQAERQKTSSSYQLTLSGFNAAPTACGPICGDRVVTPPEQCDNGTANNTGGYNKCTPDCKLGPYCGDTMVTDDETCDNGRNDDSYGAMSGCGPGCKLPARCGDMVVQTEYGEQCDDGTNSSSYGGCTSQCQRAAYCGDAVVQNPQEQCDDGVNDGTYGNCGDPMMALPNCRFGPRCGDGIVQDAFGEQCEPSIDSNCTPVCRRPGMCGDGVVSAPEQCDYGAVENDGAYGGCAPGCILAPHCGDAIKNGPEECDDGILDNSYGGCTPQCKLATHCGDGMTNAPYEQCDDGVNNGPTGECSTVCKFNIL